VRVASTSNVVLTRRGYSGRRDIRTGGPSVDTETMKPWGEWLEAYWDVIGTIAAVAIAVIVSGALGVAYNVAATRAERIVPPTAVERRASPPAPDFIPGWESRVGPVS
jgi:hypothetical protein